VTQAATQTPNKKKGNKKVPYLPTGCQQVRPATSAAPVAPQQQQPVVANQQQQPQHTHQHHHHQPIVEDDKTLLASHQNIMQNYQYDTTTGTLDSNLNNIALVYILAWKVTNTKYMFCKLFIIVVVSQEFQSTRMERRHMPVLHVPSSSMAWMSTLRQTATMTRL